MTTQEISKRLNITVSTINNMRIRYRMDVEKNDKNRYEWTVEDFIFIKNKAAEISRYNKQTTVPVKQEKMTLEEMKAAHPLVKDERMFKLSYWPETVPSCFQEEVN